MSHIRGQSRIQATLFPETLDELIHEYAPVRVIDAFVDQLDLQELAFGKAAAAATGRPGYDPADLLKLYVYGYLNQVRSSRRLEREAGRNIELLWLLNKLCPNFKTIADFRRDNAKAIIGACRAFTLFCREQDLFGAELVAIDGSKFQAVASRKQVWTPKRVDRKTAAIDQRIAAYLAELDHSDSTEPGEHASKATAATAAALRALTEQRGRLQAISAALEHRTQYVASEPEAKLMRTAHHGHQVAYNVQTAVDAKHALIVDFAVTADGNDHQQLAPMAQRAKDTLQVDTLSVVADTGYQNGEQAHVCEANGITPFVSAPAVVNSRGAFFSKAAFSYDPEQDHYRCPAGEVLTRYKTDGQSKTDYYSTRACADCPLRAQCTAAKQRSIARHFFADSAERMNQRAKAQPEIMRRRKAIVEHPFAGVKYLMGYPRLLVKGIEKASAEIALSVCGYNLKRVMNILGAAAMLRCWKPA
jgi:transposase